MKKLIGLAIFLLSVNARADLICEGDSEKGGEIEIKVVDGRATVKTERMQEAAVFEGVSNIWGGPIIALITAPGLAIKYENHFGCIRNVIAITNVRRIPNTVDFIEVVTNLRCTDPSTPFECHPEIQ